MKVPEVVDRGGSGSKVIRTRWVVTNKGTPETPNVCVRWTAQEFKWSSIGTGEGCTQSCCGGWKEQGSHAGVVDVRRAFLQCRASPGDVR